MLLYFMGSKTWNGLVQFSFMRHVLNENVVISSFKNSNKLKQAVPKEPSTKRVNVNIKRPTFAGKIARFRFDAMFPAKYNFWRETILF